jgi:3-hydroxyisobutyrate dehydrogenase-like beta-hydroxyacid dehydrogenase
MKGIGSPSTRIVRQCCLICNGNGRGCNGVRLCKFFASNAFFKTIEFTCPFIGDTITGPRAHATNPASRWFGVVWSAITMDEHSIGQIALIGFGEVGGVFGHDFAAQGLAVSAYDMLLDREPSRSDMLAKANAAKVRACDSAEEALRGSDLVISAVTAASALEAARSAAGFLRSGQTYLDINSVSPETKREIAAVLNGTPATFVEAAVMAPVSPQRLKVPMLLGGSGAAIAAPRLAAIGMNVKAVSERVGVASAIKMCRSIIIKGLEAITVESMFTARRYGAEKQVLESLEATYPGMGWLGALPDYLISRVAEHGKRRAAEMREAAQAVSDAGLEPLTALGTAQRQDWLAQTIAELSLAVPKGEKFSWKELADAIVGAMSEQEKSAKV